MSTEHDEADAVRRLLAPMKARPHTLTPERQAAVWQRIEAARARPARVWWPVWALAAAAAGAFVWLGVQRPAVDLPVGALPAAVDAEIAHQSAGFRPSGRDETSTIAGSRVLPSGARVEVAGQVRAIQTTTDMTELFLARGQITSRVPPLGPQQGFHIQTPAAQVTVRGTVFTVEHADAVTTVQVTEGRVQVQPAGERGWRLLEAGQQWTVQPATATGLEAARAAGDSAQALEIEALLAGSTLEGLERQNHLLRIGRALDAQNAEAAMVHWQRFAEDPGPHAEEVAFRHADALRRVGWLTEARAAAARFRAAFPQSVRAAETAAW